MSKFASIQAVSSVVQERGSFQKAPCNGTGPSGFRRHFLNGSCRLGSRCSYRHEWPVATQVCRYFQKGGCWYGERCRYLHLEDDAAVSDRRPSVPAVYTSAFCTSVDERGPESAPLQAESSQECSRSEFVGNVTDPPNNIKHLAADNEADSPRSASLMLDQNTEVAQETASIDAQEDGAAAAASSPQGNAGEMSGFLQRRNVSCGICMDNVYEKKPARHSIFGILPNCNHPFCKQCITTWRKMKDYGPDVVKACPQCRIRSPFYVPCKYWVEGQEKEHLIAAFKKRCSRKSCRYYMRYGCCPFNTDCLYLHDQKYARHVCLPYHTEDDDLAGVDLLNLFIAMTLLGVGDDDEEDDYEDMDFSFYMPGYYGF